MECVACAIARRELDAHVLFETESVIAFLDHDPINPGHVLICPKEHYSDFDHLPDEVLHEIGSQRVMEKLGMKREGLLRQNRYTQDGFIDEVWYGLLPFRIDGDPVNRPILSFPHSVRPPDYITDKARRVWVWCTAKFIPDDERWDDPTKE